LLSTDHLQACFTLGHSTQHPVNKYVFTPGENNRVVVVVRVTAQPPVAPFSGAVTTETLDFE
jgi:hypothetical protein